MQGVELNLEVRRSRRLRVGRAPLRVHPAQIAVRGGQPFVERVARGLHAVVAQPLQDAVLDVFRRGPGAGADDENFHGRDPDPSDDAPTRGTPSSDDGVAAYEAPWTIGELAGAGWPSTATIAAVATPVLVAGVRYSFA